MSSWTSLKCCWLDVDLLNLVVFHLKMCNWVFWRLLMQYVTYPCTQSSTIFFQCENIVDNLKQWTSGTGVGRTYRHSHIHTLETQECERKWLSDRQYLGRILGQICGSRCNRICHYIYIYILVNVYILNPITIHLLGRFPTGHNRCPPAAHSVLLTEAHQLRPAGRELVISACWLQTGRRVDCLTLINLLLH